MSLAPLPPADARAVITDAFNRFGIAASPAIRDGIARDLESAIIFDHSSRRVLVADAAGNPLVTLAGDGGVTEVCLDQHLRTLVSKAVPSAPAGDPANPWLPGSFNRTRQAVLTNTQPVEAARLKKEAGR